MKRFIISHLLLIALLGQAAGAQFFVSVNGKASGSGLRANPWDLQTALNHPTGVNPGDTIWVEGGIYKGVFFSYLTGRAGAPVVIRAYPGQEVVLDGNVSQQAEGVLNILGQHAWYWGFTITNSDATGNNYFKDGVHFVGPHNKLINCRIHNNGGNGIGFWRPAINAEIYGCIIYHNGFRGETRGHGHGIYGQNETGTKLIRDNIMFNSYGIGISLYTEEGRIEGFMIDGNIIFNSGHPGAALLDRNILVGGLQPADRISIRNNHIYNRPGYPSKASVQLGFSVPGRNVEFSGNIMVDGTLHVIRGWNLVQVTSNEFYSRAQAMQLIAFDNFANIINPVFNNNRYFGGTLANLTLAAWQSFSGQDRNSSFSPSLPVVAKYYISQNRFEPGRGHVVVYNWSGQNSILVNLGQILTAGARFQVWDVNNFAAGPVVTGIFERGGVTFPLNLTAIERPIRQDSFRDLMVHSLPEFGVFLVTSLPSPDFTVPGIDSASQSFPLKIVQCYPNPTVDILAIDFYSPSRQVVKLELFDNLGRVMHRETYQAIPGKNTLVTNIAALSGGIYLVTLRDRETTTNCKVLKRNFIISDGKEQLYNDSIMQVLFP